MNIIPIPQKIEIFEKTAPISLFENISYTKNTEFSDEMYTISIDENAIHIECAADEGKFRAETTLKQICSQAGNGRVPCLYIKDYPSIKNRGLMLDISRGKTPNL